MDATPLQEIVDAIRGGSAVPYLGPGALAGVRHTETGKPLPATGDELILALNSGQPMAPRLMYEFPRAAMHVEFKRGRAQLTKFLTSTYGANHWTRSAFHAWLHGLVPRCVIDITRDTGRVLLTEMMHGCAQPAGWALIREPSDKEQRFCDRLGLQVVEAGLAELMAPAAAEA
jgi:hypothetical protein